MSGREEERCAMERVQTPGEALLSLCAFSLAEADGCSGVATSSDAGVGGGADTGVGAGASNRSSVPSIVCCWSYFLHFALHQTGHALLCADKRAKDLCMSSGNNMQLL